MDLRSWLQQEVSAYADQHIAINCRFSADSPARSCININVHAGEDLVEIRICDDGPGIPDAMQEKIFEPFARLETSRDKSSGGYGLGLAIAARILQRHRGSIHVENCAPCGACFILRWPS